MTIKGFYQQWKTFLNIHQDRFNERIKTKLNEVITLLNSGNFFYDYNPVIGESKTIIIGTNKFYVAGIRSKKEVTIFLPDIAVSGKAIIHIVDETLNDFSDNIILKPFKNNFILKLNKLKIIRKGSLQGISIALYNDGVENWYLMSYIPNDVDKLERQIKNQEDVKDLLRILIAQSEVLTEEQISIDDLRDDLNGD